MFEQQALFNVLFGIVAFLGGWWMKVMWQTLRDLQVADKQLADKVNAIEVLVAGKYVTREELQAISEAIFKKLDRIEEKIDRKKDKE